MNSPLHINLFLWFNLHHLLFPLSHLSYWIHLLRLLFLYTSSQSLLRKHYVSRMSFFAFLNIIKHIIFNCILPLELKYEAIIELISFFRKLMWHLKLSMRLTDFLNYGLETLWRHHKSLLYLIIFLCILIDREIIVYLILLFLKIFLKMSVILCT